MRITSWTDLALCAEQCSNERWIFRGEDSINYELKPKAGRVGRYKSAPVRNRMKFYMSAKL